jgi:hypothetical protein
MSMSPGYTVSPAPSITTASAGAVTDAPTSTITPSRMTTVPLSIGAPETGTIRAPRMAYCTADGRSAGLAPRSKDPRPSASAAAAARRIRGSNGFVIRISPRGPALNPDRASNRQGVSPAFRNRGQTPLTLACVLVFKPLGL